MQVIRVTFAANQTKRFELSGKYFEIISSSGPVTVDFYDQYGSDSNGALNILSVFFVEGDFSSFNIISATAQTVEILVSGGKGGSRRQPGNVSIIDRNFDKTLAGNQFIHSSTTVANATKLSVAGIVAKTGKTAIVNRLQISSTIAGVAQILRTTGQGTANVSLFGLANKNLFGSNSVSELVGGTMAAQAPTVAEVPTFGYWLAVYLPANQQVEIPLSTPIVMNPTMGILASSFVVNRDISIIVDMEEI